MKIGWLFLQPVETGVGSDSEVGVQATFELFWSAAVVFRLGENLPALRPQHHIFENHLCKIFLSLSGSPLDAHGLCSLSPGFGQSCWAVRFQTCSRSWLEKVNLEQCYFSAGGGRRGLCLSCVCSTWRCVHFSVYCQHMKWPQMTLYMHTRIIENLISWMCLYTCVEITQDLLETLLLAVILCWQDRWGLWWRTEGGRREAARE